MSRFNIDASKHVSAINIGRAAEYLRHAIQLLDAAARNADACFHLNGIDAVAMLDMAAVDVLDDLADRLTEEADQEERMADAKLADRILADMPDRRSA